MGLLHLDEEDNASFTFAKGLYRVNQVGKRNSMT